MNDVEISKSAIKGLKCIIFNIIPAVKDKIQNGNTFFATCLQSKQTSKINAMIDVAINKSAIKGLKCIIFKKIPAVEDNIQNVNTVLVLIMYVFD